jgi:RNA polymerase sigma factor (sigma-70 family)
MDDRHQPQASWLQGAMERHSGSLLRYAASIVGDEERARDVVQDTFVRLSAQNPAQLNGCLVEWLFTVCRNRALDVQRKERRMTPLSEIDLETQPSREPTPAAAAEQRETAGHALLLLDRLPPNQQEVIRLKFQGGLSYQEISRVTRLSVSNVGFLIHTGIKTLRQKMAAYEGGNNR